MFRKTHVWLIAIRPKTLFITLGPIYIGLQLSKKHGFEIINFSQSAYSFSKDHKYQKDSQNQYYRGKNSLFSVNKLKKF